MFINEQTLVECLSQTSTYSALVATSPRGAAAAVTALSSLAPQLLSAWQAAPFYVVGDGSAAVIARSALALSVRAVGGNAELLGAAIVADSRHSASPTRLLVLSGNLRRAELFAALQAGGVAYDELTVYETRTNSRLREQWRLAADAAAEDGWVCYFSPSGVSGVKQCVHEVEDGEGSGARRARWLRMRVAALGETSAGAVRAAGWTVHAVPATPSPAQLLAAIQAAEQRKAESDSERKSEAPLSTG